MRDYLHCLWFLQRSSFDICPALIPCLHGLFSFKMLGSTFPQESKHLKGLEQPHRIRETERRVCMSILKHACKYLNHTELSIGKDASSFGLLISSIDQVSNLLWCIIFPDGINCCGISGLSEAVTEQPWISISIRSPASSVLYIQTAVWNM